MALVRDLARNEARNVLDDIWEHQGFPVDVTYVANQLGIRVVETYLREGVSGMLRVEQGSAPVIYVDEREPRARQRFTIAHELGHYVERVNQGSKDFSFVDYRGSKYDLHEFYADEFAGSLLMPADELNDLRRRRKSVVEIAAYFGVSPTAVNKRIERVDARDE